MQVRLVSASMSVESGKHKEDELLLALLDAAPQKKFKSPLLRWQIFSKHITEFP